MSFATDFIDGFHFLNKRTEESLKIAGEMSKFFSSLAACRKDYHKALKSHIASGQKKLLAEPELDGTVKNAFEALLLSIEDTINGESRFTEQISAISAEFAKFKKDNEARKKKLQSDCDALTKEYNNQLDICEKSRKNYHALAREAEKQQQALQKGNADPNVKSAKLSQMSQKTSQAQEKARAAEGEYRDVVRQTNEKQNTVYTQDMPKILQEFQDFEEMKINFMQDCFRKYAAGATSQPQIFQDSAARIDTSAEAVSVTDDIAGYVKAHATGKTCPPEIQVDLYGGFDSGVPASTPAASSSAASSSKSTQWGLGPADANLSDSQKISKLEGQISKLEGSIRADEAQASALERMSAAYAKDPVGKKKADAELAEFNERINENKGILERLRGELDTLQGGGGAAPASGGDAGNDAPADGQEGEPVKVRGLYDYTASADTELSFKEGDIFYVTLQDDSGWWYATIDDKQGFVPENYVEVVK